MKKIRNENLWKWKKENRHSLTELVFLLAGVYSIFLVIRSIPCLTLSPAVFPWIAVVCLTLYIMLAVRPKWISWIGAGIVLFCLILPVVRWRTFALQIQALFRSLTDASVRGEENVTFTVMILAVVISVLFFFMELVWKFHWFPYLTVTGVMAGAPVFGIRISLLPVVFGLMFQILFWASHTAVRKGKSKSFRGVKSTGARDTAGKCSRFMGWLLTLLVCVSVLVTAVWGTGLSGVVSSGEGFLSRSIRRMTDEARNPISNGRVSSGNNYHTGEVQLELTLLRKPEGTLYLKGFSGGDYMGGEWEPADDLPVFHRMARILGWEEWESWIRGIYLSLFFSMNERTTDLEPRALFVEHVGNTYQTLYAPYYCGWIQQNMSRSGYMFHYYEQNEMAINWENVREDYTTMRDWYLQVRDCYQQVIPEVYTQVPTERLPRLTELCAEHPMDSPEEVTAFLLAVLQSDLSYTLTPGRAPLNEDIVEYFLFDNQEGYCVHFASAATLIYRFYGIPARYVTGYVVYPSDFQQAEDGTWKAEVTDESAHAWTEIFLEEYGWTPVEVTPSSDGNYQVSYPGLDVEGLTVLADGLHLDLRTGGQTGNSEESGVEQTKADTAGGFEAFTVDFSRFHDQLLVLEVIVVETAVLFPLFLDYRRLRRRMKSEQMNSRKIFVRLMEMLHAAGYLSGYSGTEEEFPARLAEEVSFLSEGEAARLIEIVRQAAYGRKEPSQEETEYVRCLYRFTADRICEEQKGMKKFWMKYLKAY